MSDWFELSPERNPERWTALVKRINERARPILEARRRETLAGTLASWTRPVFTVSAGLAAAAMAVLMLVPEAREAAGEVAATDALLTDAARTDAALTNAHLTDADLADATLAEAMIPWSVAAWMEGDYAPTAPELVAAFEEYTP